jgi:hypothetical protein
MRQATSTTPCLLELLLGRGDLLGSGSGGGGSGCSGGFVLHNLLLHDRQLGSGGGSSGLCLILCGGESSSGGLCGGSSSGSGGGGGFALRRRGARSCLLRNLGPGKYCSPSRRVRWVTWQAKGLADTARRFVRFPLLRETRVQSALDDVMIIMCQALPQIDKYMNK